MEMRGIAGQNNDASGRIGLQFVRVELIAQADVENARDHRVDTILWVPVRHQLDAMGHSDPDRVGPASEG